jgi:hypothetical protein
MAIIEPRKAQNYPSYSEQLSPHLKNKDVRYSLYAAGSLAVAAAAYRWGNAQVGITLAFAGCFAQGYEAVNLARETLYTAMDKETKNNQISKITGRFFTLKLVWGIAMTGISLSLLYRESSLLFQRMNLHSFSASSFIIHATNLASLGYSIPCAINFIFQGDGHFLENEQNAEQIDPFPDQPIDMLHVSHLWLSLLVYGVFRPLSSKTTMVLNTYKSLLEMPNDEISFKKLSEKLLQWISSFSNPKPDKLFPKAKIQNSSDDGEKTKYVANQLFFHTLNISLMAARLYYHPFPTVIFFGLGLVYPTTFQKEKTIRRSWEIVPDFVGMPIVTKCRYLFEHLSTTEAALAWWNAPRACLNGLYLAEDFRFFRHRFG